MGRLLQINSGENGSYLETTNEISRTYQAAAETINHEYDRAYFCSTSPTVAEILATCTDGCCYGYCSPIDLKACTDGTFYSAFKYPMTDFLDSGSWDVVCDEGTGAGTIINDGWAITRLTDTGSGEYINWTPQVNDSGHVVWRGSGMYDPTEIFYYDGNIITTLNGVTYSTPQINNSGHVAWESNLHAVYYYDGTTVTQVADKSYDASGVRINNNGHIVWYGEDGPMDNEIFYYDGTTITQLTDTEYNDINPQINDSGHVVWQGSRGSGYEIFYYNGSTITQLTDNAYSDSSPQINANGHVVWQGNDGSDDEIFYYDGTTITQLTDNAYSDSSPQINASGHVVWTGNDGSDNEIFYYDGTTITQVTDNAYNDGHPQINDSGHIVWSGFDGSDNEIFYYDGTTITQVSGDSSHLNGEPKISNGGHVVWIGNVSGEDIFIAERVSDDPPAIGDGPFLAAGPWPVLPISSDTPMMLNQDYSVLWTFSDDYASCPGFCTHTAEYKAVGDTSWTALDVSTDPTEEWYAYVTLPVESLQNATTYVLRFTVTDCADQSIQSEEYYYRVHRDDDGDGYYGDRDNCPDVSNGPLAGTCYNWVTQESGGSCMTHAECQDGDARWYKWCDTFQLDFDNDGIGNVCEE